MGNPQILFTDLSAITPTISGIETDSSNPVTNLTNYEPNISWGASEYAKNFSVIINYGSSHSCNSVLIDNIATYFSGAGTILVEAANNAAFSYQYVSLGSLTSGNMIQTNMFDMYYKKFPVSTSRMYWKFTISADANGYDQGNPSIGQIFLNDMLEFNTTYDNGYKTENKEYLTSEEVSLDGTIRTTQTYAGRRINEIKFRLQNDTFKTNFRTFYQTVRGKLYPFYFIDTDGTTIRYVHFADDYIPLVTQSYGLHNVESMKLREHYTS